MFHGSREVIWWCDLLGKLPVTGRPTNVDYTCSRAGAALAVGAGGVVWTFFSRLSFLSPFSLFLGDGPMCTEILSQKAVKRKTTNQSTHGFLC